MGRRYIGRLQAEFEKEGIPLRKEPYARKHRATLYLTLTLANDAGPGEAKAVYERLVRDSVEFFEKMRNALNRAAYD